MLLRVVLCTINFIFAFATANSSKYLRNGGDYQNFQLNATKYEKRVLESRRKLEEILHQSKHKKSWQVLEEVDGLKNTEVAFFVTSTANDHERFLWER